MATLGKIDKPEVASYRDKKLIYFVRNLYLPKNATDRYRDIYHRYWKEVEEHLTKMEVAGRITKIFCESIYMTGKKAMKVLSAMNIQLEKLVEKRISEGGTLLPLESKEIFETYVDWNNCLVVVRTPNVRNTIRNMLKEASQERFAHMKSVIQENISSGEAGLLIMREEDRTSLDLPDDIEVILISPPAYDDLLQFIRDRDSGKEFWRI